MYIYIYTCFLVGRWDWWDGHICDIEFCCWWRRLAKPGLPVCQDHHLLQGKSSVNGTCFISLYTHMYIHVYVYIYMVHLIYIYIQLLEDCSFFGSHTPMLNQQLLGYVLYWYDYIWICAIWMLFRCRWSRGQKQSLDPVAILIQWLFWRF